jgi:hypothetical protein
VDIRILHQADIVLDHHLADDIMVDDEVDDDEVEDGRGVVNFPRYKLSYTNLFSIAFLYSFNPLKFAKI